MMIKYGDKITVAMIAMNEQESVKKVINDIKNIDERIEVLIVDDASDSEHRIDDLTNEYSDLNLIIYRFDPSEKWSSLAAYFLSMGNPVPASAAEPRGIILIRFKVSCIRSRSRTNISI